MEELLLYVLKSAVVISIYFGVYQLLLRNDTSFQTIRIFLLSGILVALVLPAVKLVRYVSVPLTFSETSMWAQTQDTENVSALSSQLNWWEVAGVVYVVVTGFLLLRFLLQLLSLSSIIRKGNLNKDGRFRMITTNKNQSPFSFFHYIVWNPKMLEQEDLENILNHEKIHASQWHSADVLLVNLTCVFLWFNPLCRWYGKSLIQNLEYIADRESVSMVPKSQYQQTLLKLALTNYQPKLANNFYQSLIKNRILMLNKPSKQRIPLWRFGTIVPLLLAFVFFFNFRTEAQVTHGQADTTASSVVISANATDESFEKFKNILKNQGVELRFSNVERTSEGLISNITASLKTAEGKSETYSTFNSEGIDPFGIISSNDRTYFTSTPGVDSDRIENPLEMVGEKPLFIIGGKKYPIAKLIGKAIRIDSKFEVLLGEEATKYGENADDGVIVITKGHVEKLSDAVTPLDGSEVQYIYISENSKPFFATVTANVNNFAKASSSQNINASEFQNSSKFTYYGKQKDKPLVVLDGEIMDEDFEVNSIDPNDIATINVLKGDLAVEMYGSKATEGGVIDVITKEYAQNNDERVNRTSESRQMTIVKRGENGTTIDIRGVSNHKDADVLPLYVVNGEVMKSDFDINSVKTNNIESINVLKDAKATQKYGQKALGGVIEITTKE